MRRKKRSYANRGMQLEREIDVSNKAYERKGVGLIKKLPTPVHIHSTRGSRVSGVLQKGELVDYIGMSQGVAIAFDAKQTRGKSLPLSNIPSHQYKFLKGWHNNGGVAFLIVRFTDERKTFFYPFKRIKYWKEAQNKRKSIPIADAEEHGTEIKSKHGVVLDYLSAVHEEVRREKED